MKIYLFLVVSNVVQNWIVKFLFLVISEMIEQFSWSNNCGQWTCCVEMRYRNGYAFSLLPSEQLCIRFLDDPWPHCSFSTFCAHLRPAHRVPAVFVCLLNTHRIPVHSSLFPEHDSAWRMAHGFLVGTVHGFPHLYRVPQGTSFPRTILYLYYLYISLGVRPPAYANKDGSGWSSQHLIFCCFLVRIILSCPMRPMKLLFTRGISIVPPFTTSLPKY